MFKKPVAIRAVNIWHAGKFMACRRAMEICFKSLVITPIIVDVAVVVRLVTEGSSQLAVNQATIN
jgi:hypothetical protein